MKSRRPDVYSIGYEKRSIDDFCQSLSAAGVQQLVDVRAAAWSHRPEYRKTALGKALAEHGVDYVHCKAAGNPYRPRKGRPIEPEECEALYAQHLEEHPEIVDEVARLIGQKTTALFCYEGHSSRCHRGVLLRVLSAQQADFAFEDL